MDEQVPYTPSTVEDVFKDFKGRRAAMLKALTTDVEQFYRECDPDKENLCLYGFPDENWDVSLPAEEVPPELPEPALGINFARDGMDRKDWLSLVAVHSDAWLLAVAFYYGARWDKLERKRFFDMVNELPTVSDAVTARGKALKEKQSSVRAKKVKENSSNKTSKRPTLKKEEEDDYEDDEDEEHGTFCGSCAEPYSDSQFWIACDVCQKWYHGTCVKMTAAKAANVEEYKCPSCSNKKARV